MRPLDTCFWTLNERLLHCIAINMLELHVHVITVYMRTRKKHMIQFKRYHFRVQSSSFFFLHWTWLAWNEYVASVNLSEIYLMWNLTWIHKYQQCKLIHLRNPIFTEFLHWIWFATRNEYIAIRRRIHAKRSNGIWNLRAGLDLDS